MADLNSLQIIQRICEKAGESAPGFKRVCRLVSLQADCYR